MGTTRIKLLLRRFFNTKTNREIEPDEIFLDSSNLPEFNRYQFEGRLERPIGKRVYYLVMGAFFCIGILYMGRIGLLQIVRGETLARVSENNHLQHNVVFAERGVLYDRSGEELAWNEGSASFPLRKYRETRGLAHVLGYVSYPQKDTSGNYYRTELSGKDGAELLFNERLAGENGLKIEEVDALQNVQSESIVRPPKQGENITLSIDARLQNALYGFIAQRAEDSGFVGGAGVMMDVETGEIVALVSYPEYDPQVLTDGSQKEHIASYVADSRKPFLNRIVAGLYTPGSIVKPFVALGALTEGIISPEKEILSTGALRVPNPYRPGEYSVFRDWKAHGYVDMRHALAVSSDVYFYEVGGGFENQKGLGIEKLNYYNRLFGFGEKTGIAFEGEQAGNIPTPAWKEEHFNGDPWRVGDTYNTAIGQYGFQVTPIQVVRAIAAVGNGGTLVTPSLEKGVVLPHTTLSLVPEHLHVVQEGMRMSVQEGTAAGLSNTHVAIAAKTGTAELGARKQFVNSWTTGFFPYENPRYAFAVIMERGPVSNLVGATSVMRQFIDWMIAHTPEYLSSS